MVAAVLLTEPLQFISTQLESASKIDTNGRFSLSAGVELMAGETTCQIGYPATLPSGETYYGYFPVSELKWPLGISLGTVSAAIGLTRQFRINVTLKKYISDPDHNMEDRDWFSAGRLDVYSEPAVSNFEAMFFDSTLEWTLVEDTNFSFCGVLGYMHQNFEYEANLI